MSFKRTKVVMLPTNEKAGLKLGQNGLLVNNTLGYDSHFTNQYLYILSDEEIKEGDWYYWSVTNTIQKAVRDSLDRLPKVEDGSKKIIATTDKNLTVPSYIEISPSHKRISESGSVHQLPQPSEGFIQKFVDSYNSGNPITEVDVEYGSSINFGMGKPECYHQVIKVNPKDNTVTIKKAKDTWTRDEVVNLLQQFNNDKPGEFDCSKWIEENL